MNPQPNKPKPDGSLSPMYFIHGTAPGEKPEEYLHVFTGQENDALGRTPKAQKLYLRTKLESFKKMYKNVKFAVTLRAEDGTITDITASTL